MISLVLLTSRDGAASKDELLSAYAGALQVGAGCGKASRMVMKISPTGKAQGKKCG